MTIQQDKEFLAYVADLIARNVLLQSGDTEKVPWLRRSKYEWVTELAAALYEEGFLIDTVISMDHCTNEPIYPDNVRKEEPSSVWTGFCYDESNVDYAFSAIWHLNQDKFLRSWEHTHYYELTDVAIEPKEEYDRRFNEWRNNWMQRKSDVKSKGK